MEKEAIAVGIFLAGLLTGIGISLLLKRQTEVYEVVEGELKPSMKLVTVTTI